MSAQEPSRAPWRVPLFRVFLASPGDVSDERGLALRVLERLPYEPFLRGKGAVLAVAWDKPGADTPMLATMTPQEAISAQRPKPSECDIVVVVFWSRMGTPLPPEYVKSDGNPYFSGTEWEYRDALDASLQTGRPKVLVYRRTEEPHFRADDPNIREKLEQWELVKAFFASFRNPDGSIRHAINDYDVPDTFEKKLGEHLREILQSLLAEQGGKPQVPAAPPDGTHESEMAPEPPLWEGSPFPGLRAFSQDDALIYFGRGRETDGLIRRLADGARFIAVVGASGSGKSSLVAAGLLPRLGGNAIPGSRDWLGLRFTPGELGENAFIALAAAFRPVLQRQNRQVRVEAERLESDPGALDELIGPMLEERHEWAELLLFVDQLEELFTLVAERHRSAFSELLAHAAKLPRLRVVVTLRSDFYPRCVDQAALEEPLRAGSYPLAAPGVGALYEMITRPAARAGLTFEDELPERILDDTASEPGALPLMAFALEQLYHKCGTEGRLTHSAYEGFDGVKGAISRRAEESYHALDAAAQATLPSVFRELVEVDPTEGRWVATRGRAPLEKVAPTPQAQRLVDAFTEARLLQQSRGENNEPVVEVAHEALLRSWPRLVGWIQKAGEDLAVLHQLRQAAEEWQAEGTRRDLLWSRRRWKQAAAVIDRLQLVDLGEPVRSFLAASRWGTRRRLGALGLVLTLLAAVGAGIAWLEAKGLTLQHPIAAALSAMGFWAPIEPEMVLVSAEEGYPMRFEMGLDSAEMHFLRPMHEVRFTRHFHIGKREVTFAEYDRFALATWRKLPPDEGWGREERPVINVSWDEAAAYAAWLADETGKPYRLPSEAEWEYAARGGTRTTYWWGDDMRQGGKVWANCAACGSEWSDKMTAPVGSFPANPFGLQDTSGNVWEWVQDCWHESYEGAPQDGSAWVLDRGEKCDQRVTRGGSWILQAGHVCSAFRFWIDASLCDADLGFRLAQDF